MENHQKVEVFHLPDCDFCGDVAKYDGKTKLGPWGSMCKPCFKVHGLGLGLGKGQELVIKEEVEDDD